VGQREAKLRGEKLLDVRSANVGRLLDLGNTEDLRNVSDVALTRIEERSRNAPGPT
jgi:hypothetical protein